MNRNKDNRYGIPYCQIVRFPDNTLENLRVAYHQVRLPDFVREFLNGAPSVDRDFLNQCPSLFSRTADGAFFVRPNLPKYAPETLFQNFARSWRNTGRLELVAWHAHRAIEPFLRHDPQDGPITVDRLLQLRIREIEEELCVRYLATPLDLEASDVTSLERLREHVYDQLANVYGIDEPQGTEIYFHTFNMPEFALLHLQIRHNKPLHHAEHSRTYYLDDVIARLKSGKHFMEGITDEGRQTYFFGNDNPKLLDFLRTIEGHVLINDAPNPYL